MIRVIYRRRKSPSSSNRVFEMQENESAPAVPAPPAAPGAPAASETTPEKPEKPLPRRKVLPGTMRIEDVREIALRNRRREETNWPAVFLTIGILALLSALMIFVLPGLVGDIQTQVNPPSQPAKYNTGPATRYHSFRGGMSTSIYDGCKILTERTCRWHGLRWAKGNREKS